MPVDGVWDLMQVGQIQELAAFITSTADFVSGAHFEWKPLLHKLQKRAQGSGNWSLQTGQFLLGAVGGGLALFVGGLALIC